MSHFKPIKLENSSHLLNLRPALFITSFDPEVNKPNVMTLVWSTSEVRNPPRVAIVLGTQAWSRDVVLKTGKFGICIPTVSNVDLVYSVGGSSGQNINKFGEFNIPYTKGPVLGVPIIEEGCAAWMECQLLTQNPSSEYGDILIGEIVSAAADDRIFSEDHWIFNEQNSALHTLHHLGSGGFVTPGKPVKTKSL